MNNNRLQSATHILRQEYFTALAAATPFIQYATASPLVYTRESRVLLERHTVETLGDQYGDAFNVTAMQVCFAVLRPHPVAFWLTLDQSSGSVECQPGGSGKSSNPVRY